MSTGDSPVGFLDLVQPIHSCSHAFAGAAPPCSALGLPATADINGASYSKCQTFGGANWCQSSKAPGWELCPVINGQESPAPDPVLSATSAKGVSLPELQSLWWQHTHQLQVEMLSNCYSTSKAQAPHDQCTCKWLMVIHHQSKKINFHCWVDLLAASTCHSAAPTNLYPQMLGLMFPGSVNQTLCYECNVKVCLLEWIKISRL